MKKVKIYGNIMGEPSFWQTHVERTFPQVYNEGILIVDFFIKQENGSLILSRATNSLALKVGKLQEGDFIKTEGVISLLNNEITYIAEEVIRPKKQNL